MQTLAPGTILQQRYTIITLIGQGGMGTIYEAEDGHFQARVAIKQFSPTSPLAPADEQRLRSAFQREARLLFHLHHPALPRVMDHFTDSGGQFLVMEFVPGADLQQLLQQRGTPFSLQEVLSWADQLLDVLMYLHSHQPPILHRDIKPANIKLAANGRIKLLDFGLAKGSALTQSYTLYTGQSLVGYTPHYAPLEQVQGAPTNEQSDLYSLAATLYRLLTGAVIPDAITRAAVQVQGHHDPLIPLQQLNPSVPPHIVFAIHRALAVQQADRPASAAELRTMLREPSYMNSAGNSTVRVRPSAGPVGSSMGGMAGRVGGRGVGGAPTQPLAGGQPSMGRRLLGTGLLLLALSGGAYAFAQYNDEQTGNNANLTATAQSRLETITAEAYDQQLTTTAYNDQATIAAYNQQLTATALASRWYEVAAEWPVLVEETFEGDPGVLNSIWAINNIDDQDFYGGAYVQDGYCRLWVELRSVPTNYWYTAIVPTYPYLVSDFELETELIQHPSTDGLYGISFRFDNLSNGYALLLRGDTYAVVRYDQGNPVHLVDYTYSDAISPGGYNTIRIIALGDRFAFFINNVLVDDVQDGSYASGGLIFSITPGTTGANYVDVEYVSVYAP